MNRVDEVFLQSFGGHVDTPAYDKDISDTDLNINQRVAQFLMLLQQLDESEGGLDALPDPELSEIISGALGVCGFVDPNEAREVVAMVLEALEKRDAVLEAASSGSSPWARN
jgi:hypothetical protein